MHKKLKLVYDTAYYTVGIWYYDFYDLGMISYCRYLVYPPAYLQPHVLDGLLVNSTCVNYKSMCSEMNESRMLRNPSKKYLWVGHQHSLQGGSDWVCCTMTGRSGCKCVFLLLLLLLLPLLLLLLLLLSYTNNITALTLPMYLHHAFIYNMYALTTILTYVYVYLWYSCIYTCISTLTAIVSYNITYSQLQERWS